MARRGRLSVAGRPALPTSAAPAPDSEPPEPERTCLGCRRRDGRSRLLRVVAGTVDPRSGVVRLVPDIRTRLPGRGAWVHPVRECLDLALRRKSFGRALRIAGQVCADEVEAVIDNRELSSTAEHESGSATDGRPMSSQQ